MADVGLDADLALDIRAALDNVRRLERALDAATTGVQVVVTADTSRLAGQVTSAVDSADTSVVVSGEAASLTGDVTAAVDNADTSVVVTGDASDLTGAVTSAVDAGDDTVIVTGDASAVTGAVTSAVDAGDTDVTITADPSSLRDAGGAADALDTALIASSRSGLQLRSVLQLGGAGGAAAGLYALVNAASELEQAVGGTSAVFGAARGDVEEFARGAADAAGLSEEAARRLTSGLGGLLQGFGFTQDEAAKTSVVLAQLGADLAATFGGNPEEAVQALGGALRGEFDPLERFGVSLNVTQANLRAVELGLATSTGEVDLNARAQAALSLIMERSAQAQGQFGRESQTAAGQLERAKAEAQNAAAAVGASLLPAFVSFLNVARTSLLPTLQELGETLGPVLGRLLQSATPLIQGFGTGLQAVVPIASAVATVLNAIPTPILTLIGTFVGMRAALGPALPLLSAAASALSNLAVPAGAVSGAFNSAGTATQSFGSRISSALGGISTGTLALAGLGVAITAYTTLMAARAQQDQQVAADQASVRSALRATEGAFEGTNAALQTLIESGDELEIRLASFSSRASYKLNVEDAFTAAGASVDGFTRALEGGDVAVEAYLDALNRAGGDVQALLDLEVLSENLEEQARAAIEAGLATDDWSEAQVRAAQEATRNADGSVNYIAALDSLGAARAADEAATEAQTAALTEQQQALQDLVAVAPAVGLLMTALQSAGGQTTANLAGLAVAADAAGLSTADLQAVLAQLGGEGSEASAAALQAVAETIAGVRDAAIGTLPTLQDIAGAADEFTLQGFRDELQKALEAVTGFNENLATIAAEGGPRLAAAAAELGPQYAAAIAEGIRSGNPEVVAEAELLLAGLEGAGQGTIDLVNTTIGPGLATATGQMATAAAGAFGTGFTIDPSGQIIAAQEAIGGGSPGVAFRAMELGTAGTTGFQSTWAPDPSGGIAAADAQIAAATGQLSGTAKTMGTLGKGGFEETFKPDPSPAIAQARSMIEQGGPLANKAGFFMANAAVDGFVAGIGRFEHAGAQGARAAVGGVSSVEGYARSAGWGVGSALGSGIEGGLSAWAGSVAQEARNIVSGAVSAAKRAAGIASPSKVFAEIGGQMGEGMAVGLESGASAVDAAAAALAQSAAAAADAAMAPVTVSAVPLADVAAGVGAAGILGGAGGVTVNVAAGAVVIQGSATPDTIARAGQMLASAVAPDLQRQLKLTARTGGTG